MTDRSTSKTVKRDNQGPERERQMRQDIHRAISDGRLAPGLKLAEEQLAEVFGVSRGRTRLVLQALARDKVVTLEPNRGAFVARPSPDEAREVFDARKMVETALAKRVVGKVDASGVETLREHVAKETFAEQGDNRQNELKTSHDFHVLLAELYGNSVITDFLKDLMARSTLITAIYEKAQSAVCSHVSHEHLVNLLEAGDKVAFANAMLKHLEEIEAELVLVEPKKSTQDIRTVFGKK